MNNKISYEAPSIQYWSKSELDSIVATMSGGGGGGGGGYCSSTLKSNDYDQIVVNQPLISERKYIKSSALSVFCDVFYSPNNPNQRYYEISVGLVNACRIAKSRKERFSAISHSLIGISLSNNPEAVMTPLNGDDCCSSYPPLDNADDILPEAAKSIAETVFSSAVSVLANNLYVDLALSAASIAGSLFLACSSSADESRSFEREWDFNPAQYSETYHFVKFIVSAPIDAVFNIIITGMQFTAEFDVTSPQISITVTGGGYYHPRSLLQPENRDVIIESGDALSLMLKNGKHDKGSLEAAIASYLWRYKKLFEYTADSFESEKLANKIAGLKSLLENLQNTAFSNEEALLSVLDDFQDIVFK